MSKLSDGLKKEKGRGADKKRGAKITLEIVKKQTEGHQRSMAQHRFSDHKKFKK